VLVSQINMGAGHLTKKLFLKLNKASGSVHSEETDPDKCFLDFKKK